MQRNGQGIHGTSGRPTICNGGSGLGERPSIYMIENDQRTCQHWP